MAKKRSKSKKKKSKLAPARKSKSRNEISNKDINSAEIVCITELEHDERYSNLIPHELNPLERRIRVDATGGSIPLWAPGVTLRYRFQESELNRFFKGDSDRGRKYLQDLFDAGLAQWGDAAPVWFTHDEDEFDFEIVIGTRKRVSAKVLARAFLPGTTQEQLILFPALFQQSDEERIKTIAHELGHIFGLRHFFADTKEKSWPSVLFGEDIPFTIMNYDSHCVMTDTDRTNLKRLYRAVWEGDLSEIRGIPIQLMHPYCTSSGHSRQDRFSAATLAVEARSPVQIIVGGRKVTVE